MKKNQIHYIRNYKIIFTTKKKNWSSFVYAQTKGFYQGFDEIKLDGCRPTEKRFARYKIEKYLSKNQKIEDELRKLGYI